MTRQADSSQNKPEGWVTELHLRQTAWIPHEVASANVLDAAAMLVRDGFDVTVKPTLPDVPVGTRGGDWEDEDA